MRFGRDAGTVRKANLAMDNRAAAGRGAPVRDTPIKMVAAKPKQTPD